ncbi:MAG: hypothetical protein Q4G66_06555 [bacterium]|nr:hypothetical protein [bacterium]
MGADGRIFMLYSSAGKEHSCATTRETSHGYKRQVLREVQKNRQEMQGLPLEGREERKEKEGQERQEEEKR